MTSPSKASRSMFWTLCIMSLFAILSSTMSKSPVLKPFANSLQTPTDLIGVVAAASTVPGILISLPAASLSDVFGRRKFLLLAGFIFASAPFMYLLISAWWHLILVRFYHGFATAIFVPVAEATIAELFPTKRGERISLFSSMTFVGRVIAPTLGGYILFATNDNFHTLYISVAVAGVTALIMALPFLKEGKQKTANGNGERRYLTEILRGWGVLIRDKKILAIGVVQACQYYVYGSVEFFLAGYLPEVAHLDKFSTGIVITSIIGVAIFARPYMGRISDRVGRSIPIVFGCFVSFLPLLVIPHVTDLPFLLILVIVYGFGFATVTASTPALISELIPEHLVGTSMGFLDSIMDVGQTLGPIISGFILATNFQYVGVFSSLALILLFCIVVFFVFHIKSKSTKQHG